jgi:hypothetical protein
VTWLAALVLEAIAVGWLAALCTWLVRAERALRAVESLLYRSECLRCQNCKNGVDP